MSDIKVLLVAENPLARMGLSALLSGVSGLAVAGQSSGNQLLLDLDMTKPDVIAWDWNWNAFPDLPSDVPVVALLKEMGQASEAWRAGARGLLLGAIDPDSLCAALTAVAHGFAVVEPALISALSQVELSQPEAQVEALLLQIEDGVLPLVVAHRADVFDLHLGHRPTPQCARRSAS